MAKFAILVVHIILIHMRIGAWRYPSKKRALLTKFNLESDENSRWELINLNSLPSSPILIVWLSKVRMHIETMSIVVTTLSILCKLLFMWYVFKKYAYKYVFKYVFKVVG